MLGNWIATWAVVLAVGLLVGLLLATNAAGNEGKTATCTGRVVDEQGKPIAGAKVSFYHIVYDESTRGAESKLVVETSTTASDGGFSFGVAPQGESYQYGYIVADKEGLALGFGHWRTRQDGELQVKLGQAKKLGGVVVDEAGEPIPDANVCIWCVAVGEAEQQQGLSSIVAERLFAMNTDASGRFEFARIPAEATADFIVRKPGRATICTYRSTGYAYQKMTFAAGREDIKLVLPVEARIEGTVRPEGGSQPVGNVRLMLMQERNQTVPGQRIIAPAKDGAFSVKALPAGNYILQLVREADGLADWVADPVNVTLETGQTKTGVVMELVKGGLLDVAVTEAETGKPVENASVSIRDDKNNQYFSTRSGEDGIARVRLVPGVYQLDGVYKQGFTSDRQQEAITIEAGTTKSLKRQLTSMPKIIGVVRDESGQPIQGATLQVCPMGREEVHSDAQGRFELSLDISRFPGERRQTPLLVCRHIETNLAGVTMLAEGTKTCDITLKPGVTVSGKVVDTQGRGIANGRIRIMIRQTMWSSTMTRESTKTDAEGNFEIKAIPVEHEYNLNASADGYGSKRLDITADDAVGGRLQVGELSLPVANLSVSGVVVDIEGKAVPNARIEFYDFEGGQPDHLVTQTDSAGKFTLEGLCEGKVNFRVSGTLDGRRLSARAITAGGAAGLKIVAREGQPITQYFGAKTYEQIIQGGDKIISGVAVDESGSPVAGVPVGVCCIKRKRENGKFSWSFSSYTELKATTDAQGRFAIELPEDAQYNLLFSPDHHAAVIVYDIPAGKKDLEVVLSEGGTVSGRLVRMDKGQRVPIPNVEVKIEQPDRTSYTHLGFDRDQTAITDAEGRFRFEHLQTLIRSDRLKPEYAPRVWEIKYGDTSKTIAFYEGTTIDNLELMVGGTPGEAQALLGKPLPGFDGIKIDLAPDGTKDKRILISFFDMNQRPSRNCITQLARQAEQLKEKGLIIVAVQVSKVDETALHEWISKTNIPFPVGVVQDDEQQIRSTWGVKALPWLILTDRNHVVYAEGFAVSELQQQIRE